MLKNQSSFLEKLTYQEALPYIKSVDPTLAALIEDLSPSDDYFFYLARYPYGSLIVDTSVFHLPNSKGEVVPLTDSSIPNDIRNNLSYNKMIPTGLVVENSIETFFTALSGQTIPVSLYGRGDMVALWHVLEGENTYQTGTIWSISSGARTTYMLPRITDKLSYKKLRSRYELKFLPSSFNDHWQLFSYLSNNKEFSQPWHSGVLFFCKRWFEDIKKPKFSKLLSYWLEQVWHQSLFRRNQFALDFAFSLVQQVKNLKPDPYLADTVRYLIGIAEGSLAGLAPAIDSSALPVEGLQKIFLEDYGLKKYAPVIMHPHHFVKGEGRPVYYSLEMPTTAIFSPRSSKATSKMSDMRQLKHITETLLAEIVKGSLRVESTPLLQLAESVQYGFYHSERDDLEELDKASDLAEADPCFLQSILSNETYVFPESSPFFRGCISIFDAD
jgi:hypothetical protein